MTLPRRDKYATANHAPFWLGMKDGEGAVGYHPAPDLSNREARDYARGWSMGNAKAVQGSHCIHAFLRSAVFLGGW